MGKMFLFSTLLSVIAINYVFASSLNACPKGTLLCDDGLQCVKSENWCDKKSDCEDKSDEEYCKEAKWWTSDPNQCSVIHFLCSNGICIPESAKCNGHEDCGDKSDEISCGEESTIKSTQTHEDVEATSEFESDVSELEESSEKEEDESSEEDFLGPFLTRTTQSSSLSTESSSFSSSSTPDYYSRRRKEMEATKEDTSSQTSRIFSTQGYRTPVTTPSPMVTPSIDLIRTASPDHPRQRQTTRHYYPRQSQTYDRRQERRPYTPYSPSQAYYPQTHHIRPPTQDRQHQIPDRRPDGYGRSPYNQGGHPQTFHRSPYDTRQQPYDSRTQISNNRVNHYNQSRPHDNRASIFSNRAPHPSNNRHPTVNNNVLNGEPDWREVVSLKPYNGLTEVLKHFYFTKDYANIYGRSNIRHVREGERWFLHQRNEAGDWDKDTARALVALALTNNSFPSGDSDYELMKRRFIVQLSVALLRNGSNELKVSRIAMAMNALFAVCENPRDFHALDLAELLRMRIRETTRWRGFPNPFVYLSLCLSEKNLTDSEVQNLMKKMTPSGAQDEISKDIQSLAIQAFSCYMHQVPSHDQAYRMSLQEKLNSAVSDLLSRMNENGSFGSVYSTALAAQALISVNDSMGWNAEKTFNFLKQQQREDGSFGDLLATYYVLPVLSGRSLLHLRNMECAPAPAARDLKPAEILEYVGPKQFIHYSIYFGYPLVSSHSLRVLVPEGINFLDLMKVAEYQNNNFRFAYEKGDKDLNIYSISGTPNDIEQGHAWHLYVKNDADPNQKELQTSEQYSGDVRKFFPTANNHMIFWYHLTGLRI